MRAFAAVVLALSAVAVACAAADATAPAAFSFYDFLLGEWEVLRGTARVGGEQQIDSVVRGHYTFEKQNGTLNLIGRYHDNDTATGELTNQHRVVVHFATPTTGVFKTIGAAGSSDGAKAGSDEEDEGVALFAFDFEQHLSNGMALSFGAWNGAAAGAAQSYQFACTSFDRFLITLFPQRGGAAAAGATGGAAGEGAGAGEEVTVYLGRKIPANVTQTFWQKYGTMLMVGGFFMFNMFVQNKAKRYQAQQQAEARRRARQAGAVGAVAGAKKSGATVEEEEEDTAKPKTA